MDFRTEAERAADRQLRQAEEQSAAKILNRAIIAVDRLDVPDRTRVALRALLTTWARIPRSAPDDVVDLARAVVADAGGA